MERNSKKNKTNDGISGISTAVGSAAGMVAGSFISSELNAAEVEVVPVDDDDVIQQNQTAQSQTAHNQTTQAQTAHNQTAQSQTTHNQTTQTQTTQTQTPESEIDTDTEVEVVAYETITDDFGNEVDVALVSVDGNDMIVADIDMDGNADVIISDLNSDNVIDDSEIILIEDSDVSMHYFEEAVENNHFEDSMAYNDDYVNDADVTDFMA